MIAIALAAALTVLLVPGSAVSGTPSVHLRGGLVSATFDATPAAEALAAIKGATGLEIAVPPSALQRTLTLAVAPAPLEHFLGRVLESLELAGYALVYVPGARGNQVIAVPRGPNGPPPATVKDVVRPASGRPLAASGVAVPVLFPKREAESMKLGRPGQSIIVDSLPIAKLKASACEGGSAAVQTAVVTDAHNTYLTSLIVCAANGLAPGHTLSLAPIEHEADADYSSFTATIR